MDIRFLESFVAVAECGSVSEAARRLNLTPAALSQRLRALEQDLGQPLVERVGRVVRPTASGMAVLRHAGAVIQGARDLRAIAAKDEPAGQLRLGATATAMTGLLPEILGYLRPRYPQIDYFMRPDSSQNLYKAVTEGELDAALIVRPPFGIPKSLGWATLRHEPLRLILPAASSAPWADLPPHEVLRHAPFIRYDRAQWGGQLVESYLQANRIAPHEWLELDALDAIAALVDRNLGVSILPDYAKPWPEGLRLRKLDLQGAPSRETGVLWSQAGPRRAATEAFVRACIDSN